MLAGRQDGCVAVWECMSPVSPVFYTEATVSIELKNVLRVGTSILYLGNMNGEDRFPDRGLVPILIITENRNRRASGPVHAKH